MASEIRQVGRLLFIINNLKHSISKSILGWAWIFILEGSVTVVLGIVSFWIIQDFPDTARFLTESERQ